MFNKRKQLQKSVARKGQSTVEYIVLVTAVIAVAIAFFLAPNNQFSNTMNQTLNDATQQIENMTARFQNSVAPASPLGASPAPGFVTDPSAGRCIPPQRLQPNGLCA